MASKKSGDRGRLSGCVEANLSVDSVDSLEGVWVDVEPNESAVLSRLSHLSLKIPLGLLQRK